MPRELKGVTANYLSLVTKGANKQQLVLYKSADYKPEEGLPVVKTEDESFVTKIVKSVLSVMKGDSPSFNAKMEKAQAWNSIWDAFYVMQDLMYDIIWSNSETKKADIEKELNDFVKFVVKSIDQYGIKKSADIIKADKEKHLTLIKSQAGTNPKLLKKFEDSLSNLTEVLGEIKTNSTVEKEDEEPMKVEDIAKSMTEALGPVLQGVEALKGDVAKITEKVDTLEKGTAQVAQKANEAAQTAQAAGQAAQAVEKTAEEIIKEALSPVMDTLKSVQEAVTGVSTRVEKMENLRKSSNIEGNNPDGTKPVQKSTESFDSAFSFGR